MGETSPLDGLEFRWSVAECLEHIILVENSILGAIEKTVQQPADVSKSAFKDDALMAKVAGPQRTRQGI
jgi:hypothetical protein